MMQKTMLRPLSNHPPGRCRWKPALLAVATPFLMLSAAEAQYIWDPGTRGTGSDGAGTWDTTTPIWSNGGVDTTWVNSASTIAIFGANTGAAGTVNVTNGILAGGLTFNPSLSGSYTLAGGTLTLGGTTPTIAANVSATITAGLSTSGAAIVKSGAGTLTIDSTTSNAGVILVTAGTLATTNKGASGFGNGNTVLSVSNGAKLQMPAGTITNPLILNGGTGDVASIAGATLAGPVILSSGTNSFTTTTAAATISGAISGSGSIVKNGTQKLTLTGANTFSGGMTINSGSVTVGNGGISGSLGTGAVVNNGAVSFNRSDSYTVSNAISGVGSVTKVGSGILTMTGASTYTGSTIVSGGKVLLNGSVTGASGTSNSQLVVASGAQLGGTGAMLGASAGAVTLMAGAQFSPGDFDSAGTFTTNSFSLTSDNATASMFFNLGLGAADSDRLVVTGAFSRAATTGSYIFDFQGSGVLGQSYNLITYGSYVTGTSTVSTSVATLVATDLANGYTGRFSLSGNNLVLTVVPEASTNAICLLSGATLLWYVVRRRRLS